MSFLAELNRRNLFRFAVVLAFPSPRGKGEKLDARPDEVALTLNPGRRS
jgi:hypothetical protein